MPSVDASDDGTLPLSASLADTAARGMRSEASVRSRGVVLCDCTHHHGAALDGVHTVLAWLGCGRAGVIMALGASVLGCRSALAAAVCEQQCIPPGYVPRSDEYDSMLTTSVLLASPSAVTHRSSAAVLPPRQLAALKHIPARGRCDWRGEHNSTARRTQCHGHRHALLLPRLRHRGPVCTASQRPHMHPTHPSRRSGARPARRR